MLKSSRTKNGHANVNEATRESVFGSILEAYFSSNCYLDSFQLYESTKDKKSPLVWACMINDIVIIANTVTIRFITSVVYTHKFRNIFRWDKYKESPLRW